MNVRWTREAEQDRDAVWGYIAADNPRAAVRMDALFTDAAATLADFPSPVITERYPARAS